MANPPQDSGPTLDRRFKLGKVIGRGPSGVVYAATDLQNNQPCTVKRLHAHFYSKDVLQRVQRDAQAAADLGHPAILAPYHIGSEQSGSIYLVCRFVQGEPLVTRLQRGPLSLTAALMLLDPLCAAVQAAHDRGLFHGGITPTNVLCISAGRVLLTDFGMCHLRSTPKIKWSGPMGYAAPETFDEGASPCSARGDVFSLGALVFETLTGQRMFSSTSLATFLASVTTPPRLGALLPMYEHLDAVLEMACVQNTEDRFATAGALWRALQSSLLDGNESDSDAAATAALEMAAAAASLAPATPAPIAALPEVRADPRTESKLKNAVQSMSIISMPVGESSDALHPVPLPPPPALSTPIKGASRSQELYSPRDKKLPPPSADGGTPSSRTLPRKAGPSEVSPPPDASSGAYAALAKVAQEHSQPRATSAPATPAGKELSGSVAKPLFSKRPATNPGIQQRGPQLSPAPLPPMPSGSAAAPASAPVATAPVAATAAPAPPAAAPAPQTEAAPMPPAAPPAVAAPSPRAAPAPSAKVAVPPAPAQSPLSQMPTRPMQTVTPPPKAAAAAAAAATPPPTPRQKPTPADLPTAPMKMISVPSARVQASVPPAQASSGPQQRIVTEPAISRRPSFSERVGQPLLWATVGGSVVGGTMLLLQWLNVGWGFASHNSMQASTMLIAPPTVRLDEDGLIKVALQHMAQRNYQSALSAAELVLRAHPDNARARRMADQASELLRASAVYGGFLRAADQQDSEAAAALYFELPSDSPFRVNAWEPFGPVRTQFINRHLNLATAAQAVGDCDLISLQVDELRRVTDNERDPDVLQAGRMLTRCRRASGGAVASAPVAAASDPDTDAPDAVGEPVNSDKPRTAEKPPKNELRDPFSRDNSRTVAAADPIDKPKKVPRKKSPPKPPAEGPAATPVQRPSTAPAIPSALRNPFAPK